jgi:hypothetical protein
MKKILLIAALIFLVTTGTVWGADKPLSQLTAATAITSDDLLLITDAPGTVPASRKLTFAALFTANDILNFSGTYTDGKYCTYASSGKVLSCNADALSGLSTDMTEFIGSATYAAARTKLSLAAYTDLVAYWDGGACSGYLKSDGTCDSPSVTDVFTGEMTDNHLVTYDSATGKLQDAGAARTDNATASHLLCVDSDGHIENCALNGLSLTGTTTPQINIVPAEVDGHTTSTDLTAAQVSNTVIHNYDQADSDVFLIAPAAAAGYSALFTVVTAQAKHWCFEAAASDKIYLIAAAGTVAAGDDGAAVCMMAAQLGQSFACWTFKSGAATYDWMCKQISIGTSTFEAHASSE